MRLLFMSTKNQPPTKPQLHAAKKGVAVELSKEAIANLTGYFDVLIQMDFAQKLRNERKDDDSLQDNSKNTTQIN